MLRLMIVDDEEIIREALSEMIDYHSIGYELIATAKNGMEAYDIICDEYPQVVITDIRMPVLSGLELIERSIKADSKITFILLSGYDDFAYAKQAMKYGVRNYLLKPTNKQELIDALITVRNEHTVAAANHHNQQKEFLAELHTPLEQSFIMEGLAHLDKFEPIFHKYHALLNFPVNGCHSCICNFVEESYLAAFIADVKKILAAHQIILQFPLLYVKNSAILIFAPPSLACQEKITKALTGLHYPHQTVAFETTLLYNHSTSCLFQELLQKISRFERILFAADHGDISEIRNHVASPWKIDQLIQSFEAAENEAQVSQLLDSLLLNTMPLESVRHLALGLFLQNGSDQKKQPLDIACDYFRRLYSCQTIMEIRELLSGVLLRQIPASDTAKTSSNIASLKLYIDQHLDSENLSLKWLAENYLFVSVGYLSKLFVKEEGMRFSDYLNQKRMEEAIRLMTYYQNDNIKDIACRVGFGSNPQYFSQVFKRYTGSTPTVYMER